MVVGEGFEPPKGGSPTDLQSASFSHLDTLPAEKKGEKKGFAAALPSGKSAEMEKHAQDFDPNNQRSYFFRNGTSPFQNQSPGFPGLWFADGWVLT